MTRLDIMTEQPASILVIFGITGDLSQRYLLPALYHLTKDGGLNPKTKIIGITRRDVTTAQLFQKVELCVNEVDNVCDPVALEAMRNRTEMIQMDLDDVEAYEQLSAKLNDIEEEQGECMNRLYYLSIPPSVYKNIIKLIGQAGLNKSCLHNQAESRIMVEKPFGSDLETARQLIESTDEVFTENQIFRIDHFLAKRPVQDILSFRKNNPALEQIWNNNYIASVEISASEDIGIEGRVQFYEPLGALRDFIQNHLLQIMALVGMEIPDNLSSESIHKSKEAFLSIARPVDTTQKLSAIRAQYEGYTDEVKNPASTTETYAEINLTIGEGLWSGVPVKIWTGKAMAKKSYQVKVLFKTENEEQPFLCFDIQPDDGIKLSGIDNISGINDEQKDILQKIHVPPSTIEKYPNAYETVIQSAIQGDHTLFASSKEVLLSWQIIQPVLDIWRSGSNPIAMYPRGTEGPLGIPNSD